MGRRRHLQSERRQADASRTITSCRPRRATLKIAWRTTARWFPFLAAISKCRPGIRAASPSWTSPMRRTRLKSPTSIVARLIPKCWCWAASGLRIGTTATSMVRKLPAAWISFELTPTKFLTQNEIDAAKTVHVIRAECAKSAKDRMALAADRRQGLSGSVIALASLAGRQARQSPKSRSGAPKPRT